MTYREAAALGIDDLEHGFFVATDFVPGGKPDVCPGQGAGMAALATVHTNDARVRALVADLVRHHVAVASTLPVFETFTPGRPMPPGLDVFDPILQRRFERFHATGDRNTRSVFTTLFPRERGMEVYFAHAGGPLLAGTDPTGAGGAVPGYSDQREMELLVEGGFTPLEAIHICTLNGATYLGRVDRIGSIAVGKQAELVVVRGDPAARISDVRNMELVFKQGVRYDPEKLIASVKGREGLF